ncbi:MAG: LuxR C-terminal-related transcriptional regulator [Nostoc sp.]|uniref:LuxR C-terminal-related transcriptional regulator n=1 Tax=unclassified Nostoc TaxID=2593658 RepID=UPI0025D1CAB9|nr:LuxR C-terminal-related transcriptional regulator [Nostoc sp. NMS9]MBN3939553.1 tetratricopeptide repeat protein [Nostoc sp. NMS9]
MTRGEFDKGFQQLTPRRQEVLKRFLAGETDEDIALSLSITEETVRQHISTICKAFNLKNQFPDERRSKRSDLMALFAQYMPEWIRSNASANTTKPELTLPKTDASTIKPKLTLPKTESDPNFVGREEAIADLDELVSAGKKVIVIQSPGGVGKTTLAKKYLKKKFDFLIEFPIAKEIQDIATVESLVEERLRQLGEEPGREFMVSLERLKHKLRTQAMGVLIDNLEPALDKAGRFIEHHRHYVELLRVLADSEVQSVTLITSREPLHENVEFFNYPLPSLSEHAWREYFNNRGINTNTDAFAQMHKAFGGNALVMKILCYPIQRYFKGNLATYWQQNKSVLVEPDVENLIKEQFDRLQKTYPEAYNLLCRLGCYRYQVVPSVCTIGLLDLLWDVPESQHLRVVNDLRDRSLVEFQQRPSVKFCNKIEYCNGEYWLHPFIRAEAISRLKLSQDWRRANYQSAKFFTKRVKIVQDTKEALTALEAHYHWVTIENFEKAADVIIEQRNNMWGTNESLGRSFYKRGLLQPMTDAIISISGKLRSDYRLAKLIHTLGAISWLSGDIHQAITYCEQSQKIALQSLTSDLNQIDEETQKKLKLIEINSLLTKGICQIGLWELEEAVNTFAQMKELCHGLDYNKYAPSALFYLAFLNYCLGHSQDARAIADQLYNKLPEKDFPSWINEGRLIYLALTYKNLGEIEKSDIIYRKVISYSEENQFAQDKSKALSGLAELYRKQGDFKTALDYHKEAVNGLKQIGAKYDLAETSYQLGLTYQKMGEIYESQESFDKAIQLFDQIQAPKQVEKVQKAMNNS